MKCSVLFCSGGEYHQIEPDMVIRFTPSDPNDPDDDPRDRPEEDCVDVPLADVVNAFIPLAKEIHDLRLDCIALNQAAKQSRQSNEVGK